MSDYAAKENSHYLKDKFFLSFEYDADGKRTTNWQGQVVAVDVGSNGKLIAFCLLFSWITGEGTEIVAIDVDEMLVGDGDRFPFTFFLTQEAWHAAGEKYD